MNDWQHSYDRGIPRRARSGCVGSLLPALLRHPRVMVMLAMLVFGVVTYFSRTEERVNPFTGREVTVILSPEEEVALGMQSVGPMLRQFGGETRDPAARETVRRIGARLLEAKEKILTQRGVEDFAYKFEFRVLADTRTINAFALPGGPVFITEALLRRLPSEDAVAGVIGHEIGHVLAWHSNKQMAKNTLLQSAAGAVSVAVGDGGAGGQAVGQYLAQFVANKYGRDDETESDRIGVQLMLVAGYKPEALLTVMDVLDKAAGDGPRGPEWLSTHPHPANRKENIQEFITFFREDPYRKWK